MTSRRSQHQRRNRASKPPVELDIKQLLAERREVAVVWCAADVQLIRPDLSDDQAWEVLQLCERYHDCSIGFSWTLIELCADELFPQSPPGPGRDGDDASSASSSTTNPHERTPS